jgi:hypothetical protein
MSQTWYQTIDDYSIALLQANVAAGTKGYPGLLARIGISNPIGVGMVLTANAIALGALVAFDPAGLRGGDKYRETSRDILPLITTEASSGWSGGSTISSGMVKDEEGLIIWTGSS